ncbi:MAG: hypothetical protein KGP12_01035 [Actinomycetales bacterium]|nr:hypothetical protein [Actinomycetales bacterium]
MAGNASSHKAIGIIVIVIGALMVLAGIWSFATVSTTLSAERITVSEDACMGGRSVADPVTAYCQASIIATHALEATGGKTYAELDREDPLRQVAMNGSFLRASLFTSVVSFGVSLMAIGVGIVFILLGYVVQAGWSKPASGTPA